jgi:hypothetical protein
MHPVGGAGRSEIPALRHPQPTRTRTVSADNARVDSAGKHSAKHCAHRDTTTGWWYGCGIWSPTSTQTLYGPLGCVSTAYRDHHHSATARRNLASDPSKGSRTHKMYGKLNGKNAVAQIRSTQRNRSAMGQVVLGSGSPRCHIAIVSSSTDLTRWS